MPSELLIKTIAAIRTLTDAEQLLLKVWLDGAGSSFPALLQSSASLRCDGGHPKSTGITDEEFSTLFDSVASAAKLVWNLEPADRDALVQWFTWHDRGDLYRLTMSDAQIGPRRIVPDDVWPQEPDHNDVSDSTLRFEEKADGTTVACLRFGTFEFEWDELYKHLEAIWG